jgi:hypothetical protein
VTHTCFSFKIGPLVVALNAPPSLFLYESGVFVDDEASRATTAAAEAAGEMFEPTTHAVALVGYAKGAFLVW